MAKLVGVFGDEIRFPPTCPCCGGTPDSKLRISASKGGGGTGYQVAHHKSAAVPYCSACVLHIPLKLSRTVACILLLLIGLGFTMIANSRADPRGWALMAAGVSAMIAVGVARGRRARKLMKPSCASQGSAATLRFLRGGATGFVFASNSYAEAFTKANHSVVCSVDELPDGGFVALLLWTIRTIIRG